MRIGRTLPPAAAPLGSKELWAGLQGMVTGDPLARFTAELQSNFGVPSITLVSSGKTALAVILKALRRLQPQRDELIVPAFICYAVPSAAARAGVRLVPCDIDRRTFDFDYERLAGLIRSPRLLGIMPAHLFGLPADVRRVKEMLRDPRVTVIEDAAQAMGGEWQGAQLGTLGDVGFFSLGRGKALSTVEGGVILTRRDDLAIALAEEVRELPAYRGREVAGLLLYALALSVLQRPDFFWLPRLLPFLGMGETIFDPSFRMRRMSRFQAGLAHDWRPRLQAFRLARRQNAEHWQLELAGGVRPLPDLLRFPLLVSNQHRTHLLRRAAREGLGLATVFPEPVTALLPGDGSPALVAAELAARLVTLPVHPLLAEEDRTRLRSFLRELHPCETPWLLSPTPQPQVLLHE
jgi:perosamine synthetase